MINVYFMIRAASYFMIKGKFQVWVIWYKMTFGLAVPVISVCPFLA
jgi:hypothetical protein